LGGQQQLRKGDESQRQNTWNVSAARVEPISYATTSTPLLSLSPPFLHLVKGKKEDEGKKKRKKRKKVFIILSCSACSSTGKRSIQEEGMELFY
jgi:hypothetical protein